MTSLNDILAAEAKRLGYNQQPAFDGTAARKLHVVGNDNPRAQRWVSSKIDAQVADLAAMGPDSGRNHALNAIAYSLGRLAPRWVDPGEIADQLLVACMTNGLVAEDGRRACEATITSGLSKGMQDPRDPPVSDNTDADDWLRTLPEATTPPRPDQTVIDGIVYDAEGTALGYAPKPLQRLDMALLTQPCPDPEWLVEGRMTRRSLTLLGAKPGIGKSWTALDLTIALATGRNWLGHTVPGKFRVLYIDVENGEVLARRRLQQLGADPAAMGDRLYYVTESVMFPGGADSRRYADTLAEFRPDLVVIDTLASSAPSAEKDTEAMSLFLSDVWHRAREAGASVLVLAHLRKSQQGAGKDDPLDSFRGAGHLAGAASRAWLLDPRGAEKFVLRDVKTREFPACPPTVLELVDEDLPPGSLTPKRTTVTVQGFEEDDLSPDMQFQHAALAFIDAHPLGQATTKDLVHLGDSLGMPEKTVSNLLTRLKNDGVLLWVRKGLYSRPHTDRLESA